VRKWLMALAFALVATCSHAQDQERLEANAILNKASGLETFEQGERPKFRFEAQISFLHNGKEEAKGSYARELDTPALWHEDLEFGKFIYRKVRIKNQIWTRQNYDFIPAPIEGLWRAWGPITFRLPDTTVVKGIKNRKLGGGEARCVDYADIRGNDKEEGQFCVQADTGYRVYAEYSGRSAFYSEFAPIGPRVRPRHIELDFGETEKIIADVNYRLVDKFDPVGFEPIVDGEVSEVCSTSRPPVAKESPNTVYPLMAKHSGYKGKIVIDVKVGPDGRVMNAAVAQSLQPDLDAAQLAAVRQWQFQPGTCNGNPVASVTQVTATYK
jgi:TonB family protein